MIKTKSITAVSLWIGFVFSVSYLLIAMFSGIPNLWIIPFFLPGDLGVLALILNILAIIALGGLIGFLTKKLLTKIFQNNQ